MGSRHETMRNLDIFVNNQLLEDEESVELP